MSTFALACVALLLGADPSAAEPRPFHEIDRDLTVALRSEAVAKTTAERAPHVRAIAALFTELDNDPRLLTSPTLQEQRARARGRLVNVQKTLLRAMAKAEKEAKQRERRTAVSHVEATILTATADAEQRALAEELAAEMAVAGYALGGPSQVFGAAGGGAQADYGEELVDLITQTIYPHKWEVNGGNCTIVYYRPLMCLVVTATGDVHGGVEGLLNGLR